MDAQYPANLLNEVFRSKVFAKGNRNAGYNLTVTCTASTGANISVYESNGYDPRINEFQPDHSG